MRALTPQEALKLYNSGPEAVVKALCELSAAVEELSTTIEHLKHRVKELESQLARKAATVANHRAAMYSRDTRICHQRVNANREVRKATEVKH